MRVAPVGVCAAGGFLAAAAACGLKQSGALDLALIISDDDCTAAGIFTRSQVRAAPVLLDEQTLAVNASAIRAVVANAGIANACTGEKGMQAAREMQKLAAEAARCQQDQVLVLSTGLIGAQLDTGKIAAGLQVIVPELSAEGGEQVARAIMTTDTRPKVRSVRIGCDTGSFSIGAIAKGSGMIHPDMATMLAVITTDAAIETQLLQKLLKQAADQSFNRISVDGDTSTNDTVLLLANGASGVAIEGEELTALFANALDDLTAELARDIVRDGEGASRLVEIQVSGCRTMEEAHRVAETIATSMLVKTAIAGGDPNWGRILAAAGRSGVRFDPGLAVLHVHSAESQPLLLFRGMPQPYDKEVAVKIFSAEELFITLDLDQGSTSTRMWTCDLTTEYVHINADYHT